jgi:hypothetical protein
MAVDVIVFYPAVYSKYKSLKNFEDLFKNSKTEDDLIIDLSRTGKGPFGTPKEIRRYLHLEEITVSLIDANVKIRFNTVLSTWKIIHIERKGR